jgi:hypothetical protein
MDLHALHIVLHPKPSGLCGTSTIPLAQQYLPTNIITIESIIKPWFRSSKMRKIMVEKEEMNRRKEREEGRTASHPVD